MTEEIKLYPIVDEINEAEIVYSKKMQKISYILGNMVSIFESYFLSFFDDDYFKYKRIKTETDFARFKDFMKTYPKKYDKPILVINPENIDVTEDSLYMNTIMNRFNTMDPKNDECSAKLMYSETLIETDKAAIMFRRNRYKIKFDVMMVEKSLNRQLDLYNHLIMNMRHQSKFTLERKILGMIPLSFIVNLAKLHDMDHKSSEFMEFLNKYSYNPIIRRISPNSVYMYFVSRDVSIYVDIPDIPSRDGVDSIHMVENSARVVDSIIFEADLPSEFIFTTFKDNVSELVYNVADPDDIFYIPSVTPDPEYSKEIDDYIISNKLDIMITNIEENNMDILEVIKDINNDLFEILERYINSSIDISSLIKINIYPNGSIIEAPYTITGKTLSLNSPDFRIIYTMVVYINYKEMNKIISSNLRKQIGSVVE